MHMVEAAKKKSEFDENINEVWRELTVRGKWSVSNCLGYNYDTRALSLDVLFVLGSLSVNCDYSGSEGSLNLQFPVSLLRGFFLFRLGSREQGLLD